VHCHKRRSAQESLERHEYSAHSDSFMFGMLVFETLTGGQPFRDDTPAVAGRRIMAGERPPRPSGSASAPAQGAEAAAAAELWRLHEDCTARLPSQRPDMARVAERLQALMRLHGVDQVSGARVRSEPCRALVV
jgi:hypothetical protein